MGKLLIRGIAWCFFLTALMIGCKKKEAERSKGFVTSWSVQPSLKYDACNLIGILTSRPFYQKYHLEIHREWSWNLPAPVKTALAEIDRIIGPDWPPGPRLAMLMSAVTADDSLEQIFAAIQDGSQIRERLMASDYGTTKNWQQWVELKPHVEVVLRYLSAQDFEGYWRTNLLPEVTAKIPALKQELQAYDVVGDLERFLGDYRFDRETLTLYVLSLAQPHELRLDSQRRYTSLKHPLRPTVRSFYHEMLHPYCDRLVDSLLAADFKALQQDTLLQQSLQLVATNGQPNDFEALFSKDLVMAAELWVGERRQLISGQYHDDNQGTAEAVRSFLKTKDGGAHVLAAVIYSYLESGLKLERISYYVFIKDLFASGRLQPGKIASRYESFMHTPTNGTP